MTGHAADALRPIVAADVPRLAALHARAFPAPDRWGEGAFAAMLGMAGAFGSIGRDGEDGFALARAAAGEAEVLTLAVVPEARRRGFGTALLAATLAGAAARGAVCLFLEVAADNPAARALYAAAGAEEIGRRRRYYPNGADALVLRLPIDPTRAG